MAANKVWTAHVRSSYCDILLSAQCKSSKAELIRRLTADDPVWTRQDVRYSLEPRMANKRFRRGLAIKAMSRQEVANGNT